MNPRTIIFTNVDERHECNARMNPSASNGNEIRQGRPLQQCGCGPQLELRQGLQLSVHQSIAAGKITKWGQKSSRLVLPRTALPRTSSNPGQI